MEKLRNKTLKLKSKKSTNFLRPIVQPTLSLFPLRQLMDNKKRKCRNANSEEVGI
jgi:hypothetical protein